MINLNISFERRLKLIYLYIKKLFYPSKLLFINILSNILNYFDNENENKILKY